MKKTIVSRIGAVCLVALALSLGIWAAETEALPSGAVAVKSVTVEEVFMSMAPPELKKLGESSCDTCQMTVKVVDLDGNKIKDPDVVWTVSGDPAVTISQSGVLTCYNTVTAKEVLVTAECGGVCSAPVAVPISKLPQSTAFAQIWKDGMPIETDTILRPASGSITVTYTAVAYDNYGVVMEKQPSLTWNYSDGPVKDGTITVDHQTSVNEYSYELTVSYNGRKLKKIDIFVIDQLPEKELPVSMAGWTYGDGPNAPVFTLPEGGTAEIAYQDRGVGGANCGPSVPTDAGDYTVTVTCQTGSAVYRGSADFTIAPRDISNGRIALSGGDGLTYSGREQAVSIDGVQVGGTALMEGKDYLCAGGLTGTDAGTYTVRIRGRGNYTGTAAASWTIAPAPVTVIGAKAVGRAYDPGRLDVEIASVELSVPGLTYTASGRMAEAEAGEGKPVTVTVALDDPNYVLGSGTFVTEVDIAPAVLMLDGLTWSGDTFSYSGQTCRVALSGLPDGAAAACEGAEAVYAGSYTARAVLTSTDPNYVLDRTESTHQWTILPADQEVSVTGEAVLTRGGDTLDLSALVEGARGGVTFTVSSGTAAGLEGDLLTSLDEVGEVEICVCAEGVDLNGDGVDEYRPYTGTIRVVVQDKPVHALDVSMEGWTYGDQANVPSFVLPEGSAAEIAYWGADGTAQGSIAPVDAGSYRVTVTGEGPKAVYRGEAVFTIARKEVWVTRISAKDRPYEPGRLDVELTEVVFSEPGLGPEDRIAIGRLADDRAGENRPVDVEIALVNSNYVLVGALPSVTVNIEKLTLDVGELEWDKDKVLYSGEGHRVALTATPSGVAVTYQGNEAVYVGSYTARALLTSIDPDHVLSVQESVHTWTIDPVGQQVEIAGEAVLDRGGKKLDLSALVEGARGSVTFSVVGGSAAQLDGSILTSKDQKGTVEILAEVSPVDVDGDGTAEYLGCTGYIRVDVIGEDPAPDPTPGDGGHSGSSSSHRPSYGSWTEVRRALISAEDGDLIAVDLGRSTQLPGIVLQAIAGRDVRAVFQLDSGTAWEIDGRDVPREPERSGLELEVQIADGLPKELREELAGAEKQIRIRLERESSPAFALRLKVPVGRRYAGCRADLYQYDEAGERWLYETSGSVGRGGEVWFPLSQASRYVVVAGSQGPLPGLDDVCEEDWYCGAVRYVRTRGLMSGITATSFGPETGVTRGMAVTALWRMAGSPSAERSADYADVEDGACYYSDAVRWAAAEGIALGNAEGAFGPEDAVTREQLAVMLYHCAGRPEPPALQPDFADWEAVSSWAGPALRWAAGEGILTGKDGGRLDPRGGATRAEVAQMLMRAGQRL